MRVLVVGSGGREHALAWKISQSPRLTRLVVAPGNAGMAALGEALPIRATDVEGLVTFARRQSVELVIVGPEDALALGLVDALQAVGIPAFGPSRAAAEIEWSKSFSKSFMARHGIPTARYAALSDVVQAVDHLGKVDYPVVIKADGLAAGKGVLLPEGLAEAEAALHQVMVERKFGAAGEQVVIEERLEGEEVSVFAISDGATLRVAPPAQDHKRIFDGDQGPNTGGMGAYAPVPACPPDMLVEITRTILQPAIDGLRAEGRPFVGVLYAGLMLTRDGPRVIEFNCRLGDPETQVQLPLLETDLLDVAEACVNGRLAQVDVRWKASAAACVVLASEGYPERPLTGREVRGLETAPSNAVIFHAGTTVADGRVVTSGGRVLGVTGLGESLADALGNAYAAVEAISFDGMHYRRDIGHRARVTPRSSSYAAAGVDIDAKQRALDAVRQAVQSTYGPEVLAGMGAFGGLYDAAGLQAMQAPVLVASTDSVGTKVKLAAEAGRYESLGHDIVNHCVNDILVQGARPLFFLDYFASAKLHAEVLTGVVTGAAAACRQAGCALIGGETAELPGVYAPREFDLVGTVVGVVERAHVLPRADVRAGDVLLGLRSSGPHTNGYSLIRKLFEGVPLETVFPELGVPLVDALLAPHRSYLAVLQPLIGHSPAAGPQQPAALKALAHLTGGGFFENIPRVLPEGVGAVVRRGSWPAPALFQLIQARGHVSVEEMHRVFNMGIGMVVVVAPEDVRAVQQAIGEETWVIGELVAGDRKVVLT